MNTSLFELFKIGIGPSSSHTVGPMRAALSFLKSVQEKNLTMQKIRVELYGSLALTGLGHSTDRALLYGLSGQAPDTIDGAAMERIVTQWESDGTLTLPGGEAISFRMGSDLLLHKDQMYPLPGVTSHPNGMRFTAFDAAGAPIAEQVFFSVGGGFIVTEEEFSSQQPPMQRSIPYPYRSAAELLALGEKEGLSIAEIVLANECALAEAIEKGPTPGALRATVSRRILQLWDVMQQCMETGMRTEGILPGGLGVRRRAPRLVERLRAKGSNDPLAPLDWISVYAIAVNEENAAGGRVVTAPTNGAAGVIPAVGSYYKNLVAHADDEGLLRYFLTAAAIGILYKENASISGAEVGCQGEVGVACSMAAGGLVAALGGTNQHVEHAAEIAMEHNLGMTCDPIGGLVQIPCIERNAMGAVKAVNACRMAMNESGPHKVSLDQIIKTMYETGMDMQSRYKETSLAGLALNIIEC